MELKIFRDELPQAGAACTVKAELPLETEILISDYLPPVFKLVKCFVRPVVLQKQLQPGRLTLDGYLRCTVYYQGEEGAGLCQTEQKLPFTRALELPEFECSAWAAQVEGQTEYVNCRTVTPRRIEVRGAFGLVVSVHAQSRTELITALAEGGVEQKLATLTGVRRVAAQEKLITTEGTLRFAKTPAAILDVAGMADVRELKVLRGKAVVKGELHVFCAWRAEGEDGLQNQTADLPFQQVLDIDGLTEDCRCLCVVEPVGFTLTQGDTEPAEETALTATVMLHFHAWRPYQLQYVADAFSTRYQAVLTAQQIWAETLLCPLDETVVLKGSGGLPDAGAAILACFASFGPAQLTAQPSGWALTTRAVVTAFAQNSLGELESYEKALELALPLPAAAPPEAQLYPECWLSARELQCMVQGGVLEVRLTVRVEGAILCRTVYNCIGGMELGEPLAPSDPEISLRIYYAQAGEQLFDIARRFSVSPRRMLEANDLPEDTQALAAARRLLVPGN